MVQDALVVSEYDLYVAAPTNHTAWRELLLHAPDPTPTAATRRQGAAMPTRTPVATRLRARLVEQPNGCIEYTGARDPKGYGRIQRGGRGEGTALAHRLAWEATNGPIPDGLFVCHHCDNPPCCNVDHLFLGAAADNTADMLAKGRASSKTHCPQGHAYDAANTYSPPSRPTARFCRACAKTRSARFYRTHKETPAWH